MAVPKKRKSTLYRKFALLKLKKNFKNKKFNYKNNFSLFYKFNKFFKKFMGYVKF